jgi:hypothetical protein
MTEAEEDTAVLHGYFLNTKTRAINEINRMCAQSAIKTNNEIQFGHLLQFWRQILK